MKKLSLCLLLTFATGSHRIQSVNESYPATTLFKKAIEIGMPIYMSDVIHSNVTFRFGKNEDNAQFDYVCRKITIALITATTLLSLSSNPEAGPAKEACYLGAIFCIIVNSCYNFFN